MQTTVWIGSIPCRYRSKEKKCSAACEVCMVLHCIMSIWLLLFFWDRKTYNRKLLFIPSTLPLLSFWRANSLSPYTLTTLSCFHSLAWLRIAFLIYLAQTLIKHMCIRKSYEKHFAPSVTNDGIWSISWNKQCLQYHTIIIICICKAPFMQRSKGAVQLPTFSQIIWYQIYCTLEYQRGPLVRLLWMKLSWRQCWF